MSISNLCELPRKYFGVEVSVETVDKATVRGHIIKYVTGAYVEIESKDQFHLIPWTSILDIWVGKEREA